MSLKRMLALGYSNAYKPAAGFSIVDEVGRISCRV